jgi:hypothetical protein
MARSASAAAPLQALAFLAEHRRAKILPACEAVFSGEHKLGVSQR